MSTIVTIAAGDQITNSRTDINSNFSALNTDKIETSVIDTDTAMAANSDAKIPSQKAVKTYIDTQGGANASTTARGVVEEATEAEVLAQTAAGGTGARLFVNPSVAKFKVPTVQTFAATGTYTKPSGLHYAIVEMVGGGGGGAATSANTNGGGGSGAYGKWLIAASAIGATETVTIGAAGAAGSSGNGGAGGTTSFGALATASGGGGGVANGAGGAGGTVGGTQTAKFSWSSAGGDILNDTGPTDDKANSGAGGDSMWGKGGQMRSTSVAGATGLMVGDTGKGYGAGASGSIGTNTGAAGTIGYMMVWEYYA